MISLATLITKETEDECLSYTYLLTHLSYYQTPPLRSKESRTLNAQHVSHNKSSIFANHSPVYSIDSDL